MPSGKNIGNITADINNTVINGTPRQNSINDNDEYLTTDKSDLLPNASIMPIGKQNIKEKKDTIKEAKILEVLNHPNIIRFKEVYKTKKG